MNHLEQAILLIRSGDRSYSAYQRLQELAAAATDEDRRKIGDLIENFIVRGGRTRPERS